MFRLIETGLKDFSDIKAFKEEIPPLDKYEILVKSKAVTLNYREIITANGAHFVHKKDKVIPACDGAGNVVQVGSAVTDLQVGDRVITCYNPTNLYGKLDFNYEPAAAADGVLSEYKIVTGIDIIELPKNSHLSYT